MTAEHSEDRWSCDNSFSFNEALRRNVKLLAAAEAGDNEARYELALNLWRGSSFAEDRQAAFRWFELAAMDGHGGARVKLGNIWRLGLCGKQSLRLASFWYERATENGRSDGLFWLALSQRQTAAGDERGWLNLLQRAADAGYINAAVLFADHLLTGCCITRNWALAVHYYRIAACNGDLSAYFLIGQIYRHGGAGVKGDMSAAVLYFRQAAVGGLWQAQIELARTLLFINPASREAIEWLRQGLTFALEEDVLQAVERVRQGELRIGGWMLPRPPLRVFSDDTPCGEPQTLSSREEVLLLSELGDSSAQLQRAEALWISGCRADAIAWAERAARIGCAEAQYKMAIYLSGSDEQVYWCRLAAGQGHQGAHEMLVRLEAGAGTSRDDQEH